MNEFNLLNLEQLKNEKDSKEFANKAYDMLVSAYLYISDLKNQITHLEELLKNVPTISLETKDDSKFARKSHQMEIIEVEFKRMHDDIVMNGETLSGTDLKKFEILIKSYVALKNGDKLPKLTKEEKSVATADLLRIVSGEDDE